MQWQLATVDQVKGIVEADLTRCDPQQKSVFRQFSVEPYFAPLVRYGNLESVVVVAKRQDEAIYWEDVEEGFNLSRLGPDGMLLEHRCNQDELGIALNRWIEGRSPGTLAYPHVG